MDDADRADSKIDDALTESLENVRRRMEVRELEPVHACHWCGEYITDMRLFCCKECSDDWTQDKRFHR